MYSNLTATPSNNHFSTTSSVYSLTESEVAYKHNERVIMEEDENSEHFSEDDLATSSQHQFYETASERENSNPSFSSINRSLLRNDSSGSVDTDTDKEQGFDGQIIDDDATPKLPQVSSYRDQIDDSTPVLGSEQVFKSESSQQLDLNRILPQQTMSNKFKRLSSTLQNSSQSTSNDSHTFMTKFNNNVRSSVNESVPDKRTSLYYNKINETMVGSNNQPTDEDREISVIHPDESDVSTVSNRSSIISDENDVSQSTPDNGSISNESNFNFNSQPPVTKSSYKTSTKPVPLKIIKNQSIPISSDDIPARGDLIGQLREPVAGLNISYSDDTAGSDINTSSNTADVLNSSKADVSASSSNADLSTNKPEEEEELCSLFVRALHPFDSSTLQSEADASICLAFERDDVAVVHSIDESGWGEVTLIETLERGWVPMNYFKFAIDDQGDEYDDEEIDEEDEGRIPNNHFMKPLFNACGKFLINPLSHKNRKGKFTFSIRVVNAIRDGVRVLLQETDCLSRSNEIVTKRPIVRKARKTLLADWYNLMKKANEFKGTSDYNKIEILTLMVFQVIRRAIAFLQLWSVESKQIIKKENERKLQNDMNSYPLLDSPPLAKQRVTEINGVLYSYLGIIIGRLDLIEHNSIGCDLLETLTHHIILLLRELLFISKTGSDFSSEKPADLDHSLDSLLSLVSDLVTAVKSLVVKTLNETTEDQKYQIGSPILNGVNKGTKREYYYTSEGGELIQIASKMIRAIGVTVASIRKLLEITGNFKLNAQRSYPDYAKMRIEPAEFIKKCSLGIAKSNTIRNRQLRTMKPTVRNATNRYSMMRSGKTGELGLTPEGAGLLHDVLLTDIDGEFSKDKEFEKFTNPESSSDDIKMENELLVDGRGNLLGASFKGLIYTLTNENSPPEYFFVSTFFICFRSFASGSDLIEELISRFDINNNYKKNIRGEVPFNLELKIKNRRRLIAKMFQLWLESYWDQETDYQRLPTLMNFFNEGVSQFLPLDSMKLLDVTAKLFSKPLTENHKQGRKMKQGKQLVTRSITATRLNRKNSLTEASMDVASRYSMVDGYELSKINTNSSTSGSIKSISLPLPLGIGNQTSSSSSLLSKNNVVTIEKLILTYRAIIGQGWCPANYISSKHFIPLDLPTLLPNWYSACDQSWVLSNYRPNLLDFNGLELAKQLTLIESSIFCNIRPEELLNENYTTKRAHLKLAPHVRQSLMFTNCLSGYVLESILQPDISLKMRSNMVKTWLKIAISCLYLRNFNSLAAIITSLQSHLITRITKLWTEISGKYNELYEYLSGIIHPNKNYSVYRAKLRNFLVANDYNIPTVPYFPLFLQDLTFVTDGNPNYRQSNDFLNRKLINIDKHLKTARIIADIESLQIGYDRPTTTGDGDDYTIIPVSSLQELILLELWKICQLNKKEEDRAWKLSCSIQPRDAR